MLVILEIYGIPIDKEPPAVLLETITPSETFQRAYATIRVNAYIQQGYKDVHVKEVPYRSFSAMSDEVEETVEETVEEAAVTSAIDDLKPAYPAPEEFNAAVVLVISHITCGDECPHDVCCVIKAGWIVVGYAASMYPSIHDGHHAALAMTNDQIVHTLEIAASNINGVSAIDWKSLAVYVLQLVLQLLSK